MKPTNINGKLYRNNPVIINGRYNSLQKRIVEYAFSKLHLHNKDNKSRHISIIVEGKNIIEFGINDEKNNNIKFYGYMSRHSEYDVIRRYLRLRTLEDLKSVNLYNCRINRFNEIVNSRPCKRCANLLQFFPVKSVFFTNEMGDFMKWRE